MSLQAQFDTAIALLKKNEGHFAFVNDLLDLYQVSTISFHCFDKSSASTEKPHLLNIYETRFKIENDRKDGRHVFGYDTMLPNLRNTKHESICISDFTTKIGSFIIFSDFNKKDLIGVLFSKTTLQLKSEKMNKLSTEVKASDGELYELVQNENIFINGLLEVTESIE